MSILKLSTEWQFHSVRQSMIEELLLHTRDDPILRIIAAKKYGVLDWLVPAINALAQRDEALDEVDVQRFQAALDEPLDVMRLVINIAKVRETLFDQPTAAKPRHSWPLSAASPCVTWHPCHYHGTVTQCAGLTGHVGSRSKHNFTAAICTILDCDSNGVPVTSDEGRTSNVWRFSEAIPRGKDIEVCTTESAYISMQAGYQNTEDSHQQAYATQLAEQAQLESTRQSLSTPQSDLRSSQDAHLAEQAEAEETRRNLTALRSQLEAVRNSHRWESSQLKDERRTLATTQSTCVSEEAALLAVENNHLLEREKLDGLRREMERLRSSLKGKHINLRAAESAHAAEQTCLDTAKRSLDAIRSTLANEQGRLDALQEARREEEMQLSQVRSDLDFARATLSSKEQGELRVAEGAHQAAQARLQAAERSLDTARSAVIAEQERLHALEEARRSEESQLGQVRADLDTTKASILYKEEELCSVHDMHRTEGSRVDDLRSQLATLHRELSTINSDLDTARRQRTREQADAEARAQQVCIAETVTPVLR
jgi:hypothetical protein